jgi:hypothetical protein
MSTDSRYTLTYSTLSTKMAGSGNVNVEAKNQRKSGMSGTILYDYASKGSKCWSSSVLKGMLFTY